ncbi:FAD-dependent oxidoreductase [Shewanella abyssi]|uniref:FAD-binding oxidoreductase n=1 Tax=Shewanella abyssi TaxID=311789 RepID=UPI00200FA7D1|nr:FAD-dependent oxidoreductase [Shewanella abyssi]MCL1050512.1 FAD-dependent oxidoreductase [Shewanella abyssi]
MLNQQSPRNNNHDACQNVMNALSELINVSCLSSQRAAQYYEANTIAVQRQFSGAIIVQPILAENGQKREEENIRRIIMVLNEFNLAFLPISSGHNWGYGSSMPVDDDREHFILDLSNLKRIKLNEELAIVNLQPGVTQQDLRVHLDQLKVKLMVPVTGAGPSCSIVGNALERGYGITPYCDHFAAVTSLRVVLADGTVYCSAVNSLDHTEAKVADIAYKWGLGAYLDGLFSQSNFGVVTNMSIRLAHLPEEVQSFYLFCENDADLNHALPLVREILRDFPGVVGSINIMDARRMLSMMVPSEQQLSLSLDTDVEELKRRYKVGSWTCVGSLYGKKGVVKAVKKAIRAKLNNSLGVKRAVFISAWAIAVASKLLAILPERVLTAPKRQLETLRKSTMIMRGEPNQVALPLAYWRNNQPPSTKLLNPARDNCGLLWYAPLIPATCAKTREFVDMVRSICLKHGVEPLITMTALQHDCIDSTVPLLFDRNDRLAVASAKDCLDELFDTGCKRGFIPYRLNVDQQKRLLPADDPHWLVVKKIKAALDPNNILAPGRYNP